MLTLCMVSASRSVAGVGMLPRAAVPNDAAPAHGDAYNGPFRHQWGKVWSCHTRKWVAPRTLRRDDSEMRFQHVTRAQLLAVPQQQLAQHHQDYNGMAVDSG
jgi:hypothetical protein